MRIKCCKWNKLKLVSRKGRVGKGADIYYKDKIRVSQNPKVGKTLGLNKTWNQDLEGQELKEYSISNTISAPIWSCALFYFLVNLSSLWIYPCGRQKLTAHLHNTFRHLNLQFNTTAKKDLPLSSIRYLFFT